MDRLVIDDLELNDKRVLMRVDFNVPITDGKVTEDTRIQAAVKSIKKVIADGGKLILMSHLGRPKGEVNKTYTLQPAAKRLSEILGKEVKMAGDCVGSEVESLVNALNPGDVLMLENTRFHKEEIANDEEFAKQLAAFGDVFINDAFGTAHRAHASTVGVTKTIKECAAGYLLQDELLNLDRLLEEPEKPFVAILGGAKVSDKIKVIQNLVTKVTSILIGGGMSYTFLKAQKIEIGNSLLDEEHLPLAHNTLIVADNPHPHKKFDFILPRDHIVARKSNMDEFKTNKSTAIADGWLGVDIGPETIAAFKEKILKAKTILWNGPLGIFENDNFAKGTIEITNAVAEATAKGAFTVIGGGDSVAALEKAGVKDKISHVSTGGGASLEYMAGVDLPGIMALTKAKKKAS